LNEHRPDVIQSGTKTKTLQLLSYLPHFFDGKSGHFGIFWSILPIEIGRGPKLIENEASSLCEVNPHLKSLMVMARFF